MTNKRATARYTNDRHSPPLPPTLHDVSDGGRVAIFDPKRCETEACWIQIDEGQVLDRRRCR